MIAISSKESEDEGGVCCSFSSLPRTSCCIAESGYEIKALFVSSFYSMAEACVSTADKDDKVDNAIRKMFKIAPFIWNKKDEFETNKPEEAINVDNSQSKAAERLKFRIICVGPFGGRCGKGVFIEDYLLSNGTIEKNPDNFPVIGAKYTIKNLY